MSQAVDAPGLAGWARARLDRFGPGLFVVFTVAAAARFASEHYGAPATLFALLIGIALNFLTEEGGRCVSGVQLASGRLLKIGVALLGARVTLDQIASLGIKPIVLIPGLILLTIGGGVVLARLFKRSDSFGLLTGGAVAICGASAALALSSVMAQSEQMRRDTLFTVVAVTSLSTVAMVGYPVLFAALGLSDAEIGILIGATIHDVAQVVGAGYSVSEEAGDVSTYVKLLRVACLPIVVIAYALVLQRGRTDGAKTPFPFFAVGFGVVLVANSVGLLAEPVRQSFDWSARWLLLAAIAGLGMKTSLKSMFELGPRHAGVVVAQTGLLLGAALIAVTVM